MDRRQKLLERARQNPKELIEELLGLEEMVAEQQQKIRAQELEIAQLKRQLFGASSEKLTPDQEQQLAEVAADLQEQNERAAADSDGVIDDPAATGKKARRSARMSRLPVEIEVIDEQIEPPICAHCGELGERIGEEVTEEIDYIPARLVKRRIIRVKRVCRCGCGGIAIAPLPPRILPGSKLGTALGVFILLSKYDDHLALYTVEKIFRERHGVVIPRQQMVQWIEAMAGLLQPLVELMWSKMKKSGYLQIDETPVKVLDPEVQGKAATGYLWFFGVPGGDLYLHYNDSRSHKVPLALLEDFAGTFQSDGFEGYETLLGKRPDLQRLACAAHARRKFYTAALEGDQQGIWFISLFRRLYQIEKSAEQSPPEQRQNLRQIQAPAIWNQMHEKALELAPTVLPKSSMGKAVKYFLSEYESLKGYLRNPDYKIDNNLIENDIRPSCVGKRRWLFIGHPQAGWRSAVVYSVIQSCRRRGINPQDYLSDVLGKLGNLKTSQLEPLLPANWKKNHADSS